MVRITPSYRPRPRKPKEQDYESIKKGFLERLAFSESQRVLHYLEELKENGLFLKLLGAKRFSVFYQNLILLRKR